MWSKSIIWISNEPSSMTRVIVRPAGAERETLFVALLALAILAGAGATAALRSAPPAVVSIEKWQIDAREGLNAAEQGLNADLTAAADDIALLAGDGGAPSVADLAADGLPPFIVDTTSTHRGAHVSTVRNDDDGAIAYIGESGDHALAGSLLLRLAAVGASSSGESQTIWINRTHANVPGLDDAALIAEGWKQVTSNYDASVTREIAK
jgi:hypothetical protein